MTNAIINVMTDLTDGGCNACGPVMSDSHTLTIEGKENLLTDLTVSGLVMGVAQQFGWQQAFRAEIIEEYYVFSQDGREVKLVEEFNRVTYSKANLTLESANEYTDSTELFEKVNQILSEMFGIERLTFIVKSV